MENANPYTDKLNSWSSHSRIAAMLVGLPRESRVLDVGAASGTLARVCAGRGYVMRGIEPNSLWLDKSRNLYSEMYEGSLEQAPDSYLAGHSAVVCGDVLEHLVQPEAQLKRLTKAQLDGCIFIISVPNVANLWVRLNLLFGHFDYADKGILDRSHLHFYTLRSFKALLRSTGLQLLEIQVTPIPLDLITPFFSTNQTGRGLFAIFSQLTQLWPTLFAYQWIAKATSIVFS
jgi:2-polyprenyl-3-methyl-5-hydroxy-6-metoxy-1,4-benzoquinol methylase